MLNFQTLDVYRCAVTFLGRAAPLADRVPRGYAIARGSAFECAAVLDAFETLGFVPVEELAPLNELVERVVSMLTKMALK